MLHRWSHSSKCHEPAHAHTRRNAARLRVAQGRMSTGTFDSIGISKSSMRSPQLIIVRRVASFAIYPIA